MCLHRKYSYLSYDICVHRDYYTLGQHLLEIMSIQAFVKFLLQEGCLMWGKNLCLSLRKIFWTENNTCMLPYHLSPPRDSGELDSGEMFPMPA